MSADERTVFLPRTQSHDDRSMPWILGALSSLSAGTPLGYKAVISFLESRRTDGFIFGAGVLICIGACVYCGYRVVTSLSNRNPEPIAPTFNDETNKAHEQMLKEVDRRLKELLGPEENIDLEAAVPLPLHDSIRKQLVRLEALFPELRAQIEQLEAAVQQEKEKKIVPATPPSPFKPSQSLDESVSLGPDFEDDLLDKLDALAAKIARDRSSARSSRNSSRASTPQSSPIHKSSSSRRISLGGSPLGSIQEDAH